MASRALEPAIHAPGYQINHCLPPAGLSRPKDLDVYRFQRVVPLYTPDPAVAPDSAQLLCPPSCGQEKRNDLMPPAGRPNIPGDSFQFYDTRQAAPKPKSACSCPFFANGPPCTSLGPITDPLQCPCINRCRPVFKPRPWSLETQYPGCLWPPCGQNKTRQCKQCRKNDINGNIWCCPGNDPNVGPKMAMFLRCDDAGGIVPPC